MRTTPAPLFRPLLAPLRNGFFSRRAALLAVVRVGDALEGLQPGHARGSKLGAST